MTEREEFELVAQAAGYELRYENNGYGDVYTIYYQDVFRRLWNPKLKDDCSRRLQVDLGIGVRTFEGFFDAHGLTKSKKYIEKRIYFKDHPDKYAAFRAAVWDVAVEVAKRRVRK